MDLPYIILILILLFFSYHEHLNPYTKVYKWAELLIILFIGLRAPTVGADTLNYVKYFTGQQNFYNYDTREIDIFFPILNKLLGVVLFHNGTFFLLFNAIASLLPVFYLINRFSQNKSLSVTFIFIGMFHILYFVALRQIYGLSLLLWGVIAILVEKRNKWIIYGVLTMVGYCFHESTLLFSLCYLAAYFINLNKKTWYIVIIFAFITRFVVSNLDLSLVGELYTYYQTTLMERTSAYFDFEKAETTLNIFSVTINFVTVILVVTLLTESNLKLWLPKIYLLGYCIGCFLSFWPMVYRVEAPLTLPFIIVFTWILKGKNKWVLTIATYSIIIFNILTYLKRNIVYDKDSLDRMHPYSITKFE